MRKWYHTHLHQIEEFRARYLSELDARQQQIHQRLATLDAPVWTLSTAAKNPDCGHVAVLKSYLQRLPS